MAFVKFTATGRSFAPKASINPRGSINFSDGARRRFDMDKYAYIVLHYDNDSKLIGVQMCNDEAAEGAIKLRIRKAGGASLGAKSFVEYFDLNIQKTTMYDVRQGEDPTWVIIDLKTARERNSKDDEDMGDDENAS